MDNHIMLTGAGFTHNFGTPLANRLAEEVLNFLQDDKLKDVIRKYDFDYERAYQHVLEEDDFTQEQKKLMNEAVKSAYKTEIDNVIRDIGVSLSHTIHSIEANLFLKAKSPFFIFTLNQDLFFERKFWGWRNIQYNLMLPARSQLTVHNHNNPLMQLYVNNSFRENIQELEDLKKEFRKRINNIRGGSNRERLIAYIKLHGSMDWIADEENQLMIIGGNKENHIQKYPLLKWYYDMFKEEVSKDNTKLLIIGYGFTDEHINSVLKEAILQKKLELYIINPNNRGDFERDLGNKRDGSIFIKAIKKYYSYDLITLFPNDNIHNVSSHWEKIEGEYLGVSA